MSLARLIGTLIAVTFAVAEALMGGYALSVMWEWFVIPVFKTPKLPYVSAAGITLCISMMTKSRSIESDDKPFNLGESISEMFDSLVDSTLYIGTILLLGWILHTYF